MLLTSAACGTSGLNFVTDERLEFTAPDDREEVSLPVDVTWTVSDFEITGRDGDARTDAGYFGVYLDRAPQPPGKTQEWLVRDDPGCRPPCADEAYLAQRNVFSTTEMSFRVDQLEIPSGDAAKRRDRHEATIVLLNGRGERIGESAFVRQFEVVRS
jgi:hypothetical protein